MRTRLRRLYQFVNDPLGILEAPLTSCNVVGHSYRWSYDLSGYPRTCYCLCCDHSYWDPS